MISSNSNSKKRFDWIKVFSLLMYVYMYLPILVLGLYSFNESPFSAEWTGFTFKWYIKLFFDQRIFSAFQNSLIIAVSAVGISAVFGTLMAVGLARYNFPLKILYRGVSYLPLIVPDIAIAVSTLIFLAVISVPLSLGTVIAAHIVFCLAYICLVVSSRMNSINRHLEEAAMDLGATPYQAFVQVLFPELKPAIMAGCLLSFVLSMDDFLIASFTSGVGATTIPMEIFSRIRTGVKPDINALSVIIILISAIVAIIGESLRNQVDKS